MYTTMRVYVAAPEDVLGMLAHEMCSGCCTRGTTGPKMASEWCNLRFPKVVDSGGGGGLHTPKGHIGTYVVVYG